jgi:hypothetical protein
METGILIGIGPEKLIERQIAFNDIVQFYYFLVLW